MVYTEVRKREGGVLWAGERYEEFSVALYPIIYIREKDNIFDTLLNKCNTSFTPAE
jgi:hypothetical protein